MTEQTNEKIRILFLAANPADVKRRLDLDKEVAEITDKIARGTERDAFVLQTEWCVQPDLVQEALYRHQPHILHFSGHASRTGIALEDRDGKAFLVESAAFARMLRLHKDYIRIVVLNACDTKELARSVAHEIDYTVGMNRSIRDDAARVFAAYFYQVLAFGRSVPDAFESALAQLDLSKVPGSDVPELLVRPGVDTAKPLVAELPSSRERQPANEVIFQVDELIGDDVVFANKHIIGDADPESSGKSSRLTAIARKIKAERISVSNIRKEREGLG